jgi:nuclear pore complex protein Nup205
MNAAAKASATERGGRSKGKGKRKLADADGDRTPRARQHKPITEHFSSSQDTFEAEDAPRSSLKRAKRDHSPSTPSQRLSKATGNSLASMYRFPSSRPTPNGVNGVVDLTGSSPTNSPQSPMRNKSLVARDRPLAFTPYQGPKKLVVKNLRTVPRSDPEQYFEKVWGQLDSSLTAIFKNERPPHSCEELYRGAENVCRQGKAAETYKRLRERCTTFMSQSMKEELRSKAQESSDIDVLKAFVGAWMKWSSQLQTIHQIFYFMDQTYLLRSAEHPNTTETGLELFRASIFADSLLKPKILNGAVDLVDLDRRGKLTDEHATLLRTSIDTFHELSVYTKEFEPILVESSASYLTSWRYSEAEKGDLAHYADECTRLFGQEMTRCDLFKLDSRTRAQLADLFDNILIEENAELLTDDDKVTNLMKTGQFQALEQVYSLLQRKGLGEELGPTFNCFVVAEGSSIVFDEEKEADMVISLLDFKRRLDHISKVSFHGNESLNNGLHKSFEHFINKTKKSQANWDTDNAKPGEMIAKHVDLLLKGGVKAIPKLIATKPPVSKSEEDHEFDEAPADEDAEINLHLSHALDLFRFVHGKAVFEAFYKKDLARRLLMGRSASNDAERSMLTRLKNECGAGFTHNLEAMFKDMDLSRDEMASYNQLLEDRGDSRAGVDLAVNVLSASSWPTYPDVPVNIPPEIMNVMSNFETHYQTKHNGRKLTWKHALAHCQLKAKFPRGNKELVVSGFQAIVLLLFNDVPSSGSLSYTHVQASTGLSDADLQRTLQSLACAKYRVLVKSPRGRDVNPTDTFAFNTGFEDAKLRIKINQVQLKETKEENKETHQRVAADRHYETQAAIVRIMKSRKKIRHVELISEVIKATKSRGVLDPADIKKNIEKYVSPIGGDRFWPGSDILAHIVRAD